MKFALIAAFILSSFSAAAPATEDRVPLNTKLKEDLNFMHRTISREFSGYLYSAETRRMENLGHSAAYREAKTCEDTICYRKIVSKYIAALKDPHMRVAFSRIPGMSEPPDYPQFVTGIEAVKYNTAYYVKTADAQASAKGIKPGDEIVSCGGKTPGTMLKEDIFPYLPVLGIEADYYMNSGRLFRRWDVKEGDKLNCIFSRGNSRTETALTWKKEQEKQAGAADRLLALTRRLFGAKKHPTVYSVEKKPYGCWIKLSSLSGEDGQLTRFYEDAQKFRSCGVIVMDIRGNGGGNSQYSTKWVKNFFGYLPESKKNLPDLIAATDDNYNHFKTLYDQYTRTHPEDAAYTRRFLECMKKNAGKLAVCGDDDAPAGTAAAAEPPKLDFKGKIYLLTDYADFSSAEIFVHELRQMPGVKQAGVATGASTMYGDVRLCQTPSRFFVFNIATKVFRGLFADRKPGEPFEPQIPLKYDPAAELAGRDSLAEALEKIIAGRN